jgi:HTH-type transcriptional regulator / antitoxin HigA
MKTAHKKYQALIDRWPLRPISTEHELDLAFEIADELCLRDLAKEEEDYLHVLTMLIEEYEIKAGHVPDDVVTPLELLKFILEENNLKQSDLIKILGISSGNASEIMSGKRDLSKAQIAIIAARFGINPGVFLPAAKAPSSASDSWGISLKGKGLYLPDDGTMIVSEKYKIGRAGKVIKPKVASAAPKKKRSKS